MNNLSHGQAHAALDLVLSIGKREGLRVTAAVIDAGRNLVAFLRMDGAPLGTIEVAQGKAYTACSVEMKTSDLAAHIQPGAPFYGFQVSHRHPLVVFGGGVPVRHNGTLVGAVGVSGGSLDQDVAIAEEVAAFLETAQDHFSNQEA